MQVSGIQYRHSSDYYFLPQRAAAQEVPECEWSAGVPRPPGPVEGTPTLRKFTVRAVYPMIQLDWHAWR
jgi:hypothetical protein